MPAGSRGSHTPRRSRLTQRAKRLLTATGIFTLVGVVILVTWVALPGSGTTGPGPGIALPSSTAKTTAATHPATTTPSTTVPAKDASPSSSTTTTPTPSPQPPYPVAQTTMDFVDESRGRELDTVIYKPVGATGPLPVIVFAHGWNSDPYIYDTLLDTWAAAGYLVAAPIFPDNSDLVTSDPETDFGAQAQDMSFVLSQILSGVAGPVDPQRVAAAGHSDGGSDIATLALDPNYTDTRFKAYLCLSGDIPDYALDGPFNANPPGTFLAAVGTDDDYGLQPSTTEVFDTVQMTTKVLLTVDGGDHLYMYVDNSSEAEALRAATVRFLNAALAVKAPSNSQLVNAMQPLGDPSIELTDGTCTGAGLTPDGTCQATPDGTPDG